MVSRVWGAVIAACDLAGGERYGTPIAESILVEHEAVWNRALQWLVKTPSLQVEQLAEFDQLRRRMERWTDVLVGHLVRRFGLAEFAFDSDRARDFGEEQLRDGWGNRDLQVWDLYLTCLRTALPDHRLTGGRMRYLRVELIRLMLSSFPESAFHESGTLKPLWLNRLQLSARNPDRCHSAPGRRLKGRLTN